MCKGCRKAYHRQHYLDNKEQYLQQQRDRRYTVRQTIREYLASHPCVDCGEADPVVLEFDHVSGKDSYDDMVSNAPKSKWSVKRLEAEIAKCEVRCANCHRRRHFGGNSSKLAERLASNQEAEGSSPSSRTSSEEWFNRRCWELCGGNQRQVSKEPETAETEEDPQTVLERAKEADRKRREEWENR